MCIRDRVSTQSTWVQKKINKNTFLFSIHIKKKKEIKSNREMKSVETALTGYNKNNRTGQGTLIHNWWEERELKDATGTDRAITQNHKNKNRSELYTTTSGMNEIKEKIKLVDNTSERTMGQKINECPDPESRAIGSGHNKADDLPKEGKKKQTREQFFIEQIKRELDEKQAQIEKESKQRHFETTTKSEFSYKDITQTQNTVGKRVMKTQDGVPVPQQSVDYDLTNDMGFIEKPAFLTDESLKQQLPKGESYLTQQPITFWAEKQKDGCFYMSKGNDLNNKLTFNLNNEFVKQYSHYTHVKK
eukprot:TRINITY_DN2549_c0_g1_i3.p1 TRINITY_DN2549_c0_g1~~TRINITY_DN2549_c0_g1_i3.p1  ORF type:complete len:303 (+),score=74.77 TRINITY_DN2549_c0_g1_i3:190-1098(+)